MKKLEFWWKLEGKESPGSPVDGMEFNAFGHFYGKEPS